MQKEATPLFCPTSLVSWREWLKRNHDSSTAVWLVFYNKNTSKKTISWSEAVDVALCFGWIDSKKVKIDPETSHQFFSKRKTNSTWSKINKKKIALLIESGLMTPAGYKSIEIAQQNGSWNLLDEVEELLIPLDLQDAFALHPIASNQFQSWSKTTKKAILQWLVLAKRPETRQKRLNELIQRANENLKPKHLV